MDTSPNLIARPSDATPAEGWSIRSRKTHVLIAAAVASALAIWVSSGFTREPPPAAPEAPGLKIEKNEVILSADAPQWRIVKVAPAIAAAVHWSDPVPARVKLDETKAAKIASPLAGRVTNVFVELGQPVKKGDELFSVASPDIASLRADREKASVDLEVAKSTLERTRSLVAAKGAAAKDELGADQQYHQAMLSLRLAEEKLSSLKVSSRANNEFTLVAPRDGVVVEKNVLPSQQVQTDPLISIADLGTVWVVADLFEADASGIEVGTPAQVTSPSIPDLAVEAKVDMVSAVVDPARHTVPVRVRIDNDGHGLKPNVFAQVRFQVKPPEKSCEVAASALVSDGAKQYVYVQSERGRFTRRDVTAGSVHEGKVPILKGLAAGEVVVEEGAILLDNQIALSH
jgi:cobalt-zinc-cadmium efflux system membrane fusion protein